MENKEIEFSPSFPATMRWVTLEVEGKTQVFPIYYAQMDTGYHIISPEPLSEELRDSIISKLKRKLTYEAKKK